MAKWIVEFEGKLIVEADEEKDAKEIANTFLIGKGLSGAKAKNYGTEKLDEAEVIIAVDRKPVDVGTMVSA